MSLEDVNELFRPLTVDAPGLPGRRRVIAPAPVDEVVAQFESGEFDVVAIGRVLLADPTWVNKRRDDALDGFTGYDADPRSRSCTDPAAVST